jgi:AcrR family transcriptional regulator
MSTPLRDEVFELKRQRILDVASALFFELGYKGTSMDAIAERMQVTKPFVYYHFDNKAEILAAVCGRTTAFVAGLAEQQASKVGPVQERLVDLVRELSRRVIEGRVYLAVYFREEIHLPTAAARELASDRRRFDRALSKLLQEGVDAGAFRVSTVAVAAQAITGMTTWIFNWYREKGALTPEQVAQEMSELALSMVQIRKPSK